MYMRKMFLKLRIEIGSNVQYAQYVDVTSGELLAIEYHVRSLSLEVFRFLLIFVSCVAFL